MFSNCYRFFLMWLQIGRRERGETAGSPVTLNHVTSAWLHNYLISCLQSLSRKETYISAVGITQQTTLTFKMYIFICKRNVCCIYFNYFLWEIILGSVQALNRQQSNYRDNISNIRWQVPLLFGFLLMLSKLLTLI